MAMINLNTYKYLVTIVEEGSIIQAAKTLYTTANTLRKEIEILEANLGYAVLLRTNKGVRLTQKGYDVYEQAKIIVEQSRVIENSLLHETKVKRKIKLASFASHAISEQFFKFCLSDCEESEVCFYECGTKESVLKLNRNEVELAFVSFCDDQRQQFFNYINNYDLEYVDLVQGDLCVVVKDKSSLYKEDIIDIEKLKDKTMILRSYDYNNFLGLYPELIKYNIQPGKIIVLDGNNYYAALSALDSFTLCPIWNDGLTSYKQIKTIALSDVKLKINLGYLKKRNVSLNPNISRLIENLTSYYKN